jgi:hypothetical protein
MEKPGALWKLLSDASKSKDNWPLLDNGAWYTLRARFQHLNLRVRDLSRFPKGRDCRVPSDSYYELSNVLPPITTSARHFRVLNQLQPTVRSSVML